MRALRITALLALCLALAGCSGALLNRSYSTVTPHSASYWENQDADTLRAENYQELVNALLILLGEHSDDGVVRIYGDAPDKADLAERACVEVQKETAIGAYLLDYITYDGKLESGCYELTVRFRYRRTAEQQAAIVNVTSTEALPDLLRDAIEEQRDALALRVGYFGTDRAGVLALVSAVHDEVYPPAEESAEDAGTEPEAAEALAPEPLPEPPELSGSLPEPPVDGATEPEPPAAPLPDLSPWEVLFYPDSLRPGIVEVLLGSPS